MTPEPTPLPPRPDAEIDVGPRGDALEACVDSRVREELARATRALAELREEIDALAARDPSTHPVYDARLARVRARRLEAIEGSVAVVLALAERTGDELRQELDAVASRLAEQLDAVAHTAREASLPRTQEEKRLEARLDDVHRRIDAVTRELRAGVTAIAHRSTFPAPYGERVAETLGRRLEHVEGAVEVWSAATDRTRAELREELSDLRADAHERGRGILQMFEELTERIGRLERETGATGPGTASLLMRIEELERDRDAITARLLVDTESWASERAALHERVAELAARIVTGPVPGTRAAEDAAADEAVPLSRELDQLRIGVEGLRMRLAYHERTVSELAGGRGVESRIEEARTLIQRLERAGELASGERDTVIGQLEQLAARIDMRLQRLEATAVAHPHAR